MLKSKNIEIIKKNLIHSPISRNLAATGIPSTVETNVKFIGRPNNNHTNNARVTYGNVRQNTKLVTFFDWAKVSKFKRMTYTRKLKTNNFKNTLNFGKSESLVRYKKINRRGFGGKWRKPVWDPKFIYYKKYQKEIAIKWNRIAVRGNPILCRATTLPALEVLRPKNWFNKRVKFIRFKSTRRKWIPYFMRGVKRKKNLNKRKYYAYLLKRRNNVFVSITDIKGRVIISQSAGSCKITTKKKKRSWDTLKAVSSSVAKLAIMKNIKYLYKLYLDNTYMKNSKVIYNSFKENGLIVLQNSICRKIPHGLPMRNRKLKRL